MTVHQAQALSVDHRCQQFMHDVQLVVPVQLLLLLLARGQLFDLVHAFVPFDQDPVDIALFAHLLLVGVHQSAFAGELCVGYLC